MTTLKEYLGDSVYVTKDENNRIMLTTENGDGSTDNIIFLEREVIIALTDFLDRTKDL